MSNKAYTVVVIDNETGETKANVNSDAVIQACLDVKHEKALSVQARLYRSGYDITPQDVINAAYSLPEIIKQAVQEGIKK